MTYEIKTDDLRSYLPRLRIGDRVLLSGTIYTSRDAAHKRIFEALDSGVPLPYEIRDAVIYYAGPTPARAGMAVGSCGPLVPSTSASTASFSRSSWWPLNTL